MKSKKFDYVVGTGGIGTGILFKFQENTTLGRDESRFAKLADAKDYFALCSDTWARYSNLYDWQSGE